MPIEVETKIKIGERKYSTTRPMKEGDEIVLYKYTTQTISDDLTLKHKEAIRMVDENTLKRVKRTKSKGQKSNVKYDSYYQGETINEKLQNVQDRVPGIRLAFHWTPSTQGRG